MQKYEIMKSQHANFENETKRMRENQENIRTKFYLLVNAVAFRIYLTHDAIGNDVPDEDISKILKSYIQFWPFEPLELEVKGRARKQMS